MTGLERKAFDEIKSIINRMQVSVTIMRNYVSFPQDRQKEKILYYEVIDTYDSEKYKLNKLLKDFEE